MFGIHTVFEKKLIKIILYFALIQFLKRKNYILFDSAFKNHLQAVSIFYRILKLI
jgi:hypothetical protein